MPDFLDASAIMSSTFVRHVELHDTLPSTNDRAIELSASPDLPTPTLVATRLQTAGRGRGKNTWWAAEGALTFSLILDTAQWGITQRDWPRLSLATAVAICDAIEAECREQEAGSEINDSAPGTVRAAPCYIKWPNDVLIDDRKVGGILLESPGGSALSKDRLIVGVGINVNNSWRNAPREIAASGAALCDFTGSRLNLEQTLRACLLGFQERLRQLAAVDIELPAAWQQRSYLTNKEVSIDTGSEVITGRCVGTARDGAILIEGSLGTFSIYSGYLLET